MNYDIRITITGNEEMVGISIRQGNGEWRDYGGSSIEDLPDNLAGAVEEFIVEMKTGYHP